MPTFQFYWKDGTLESAQGTSPAQAFATTGHGGSSVFALDFYEVGEEPTYVYDGPAKKWRKIPNAEKARTFWCATCGNVAESKCTPTSKSEVWRLANGESRTLGVSLFESFEDAIRAADTQISAEIEQLKLRRAALALRTEQ